MFRISFCIGNLSGRLLVFRIILTILFSGGFCGFVKHCCASAWVAACSCNIATEQIPSFQCMIDESVGKRGIYEDSCTESTGKCGDFEASCTGNTGKRGVFEDRCTESSAGMFEDS